MKNRNHIFTKLEPVVPTIAFDTYWRFAYERQEVFYNKLNREDILTGDSILKKYKFTNAYRVCDRVSQFLIREVISSSTNYKPEDVLFRILLFKLFNKIETWQLLCERFGAVSLETYRYSDYKKFLDSEMNKGRVLYSSAYMMASGCKEFQVTRKHHSHLMLLELMRKNELSKRIVDCQSMKCAFDLLLSYPLIGSFLAYQYVTDINYSELVDFREDEFTIPGPGARDGIRKCFSSLGGLSETDIIKLMADRQDYEFDRLGLNFRKLGSRPLQYIDIQNIFCETDKYCRVAHPEIKGISGRSKIKQLYKPKSDPIQYMFPPSWNIQIGEGNGCERLSGNCG